MATRAHRLAGSTFLWSWRAWRRARSRGFSVMAGGGFASFGSGSVLDVPVRLGGEDRIAVGDEVYIGPGTWLQTVTEPGAARSVALEIGDETWMSGGCVLSAASSVRLGRAVLLARNVYISDHHHAFGHPTEPILRQGIVAPRAVEIGDGAWLGENAVICPGVRVGRGAVVGANAVVLEDVPDHGVAVGVPARLVRRYVEPPVAGQDTSSGVGLPR